MDIDQIIRRWLAGEKIRGIAETRRQHIERVRTELKEGMRRPCC
jgi:hypothetical protein